MTPPDLIPNGVPVANVPGLSGTQVKTLTNAWIMTAQELVALAACPEAVRGPLARALGVDSAGLDRIAKAAQSLIPATRALRSVQLEVEAARVDYGRGALLDEPSEVMARRLRIRRYKPFGRRAVALPLSISLLDRLPAIRDQGGRGTCVAHAALSVREQLEIGAGSPLDLNLSEQFVYWWCKGHDGIPNVGGTYVAVAMQCLNQTGAPLEETWPYNANDQAGNEGQGPPPAAAAEGDAALRTVRTQEFNRTDIAGIKACLAEGRAVAFSIPVFDSWYYSSATRRWGKITPPLPGEQADGGHAMALVGYQDDPTAPGGGYFLVRNSWRPWSYEGVWKEGYGHIPYGYISSYATAVFSTYRTEGLDIWLRDAPSDTGARPAAGGSRAAELTWNSPDIWLRRSFDSGIEHQAPVAGALNALYVRTFNRGPAYAYDVQVDVFVAPLAPFIPTGVWERVGGSSADWLKPGETRFGPYSWQVPDARRESTPHVQRAFRATLSAASDRPDAEAGPEQSNNVAERHLWLLALRPGDIGEVAFDLATARSLPGPVSFQVDRGDLPAGAAISEIRIGPATQAGAAGTSTTPSRADGRGIVDVAVIGAITGGIMGGAGARGRVSLTLTLPADAQPGARHQFVITQLQGGEVAGKLAVQVDVTR